MKFYTVKNNRFYIEQSGDFDDKGNTKQGCGVYAGLVTKNKDGSDCFHSGIFFETEKEAEKAIESYEG